jgi:hypothetical protein
MYYVIEFDPIPGVKRQQIVDAYREYVDHFRERMPNFKFHGLFARNILLGSRPHYIAIWEFSTYSDLDEWNRLFATDTEGRKIAESLSRLATAWEAKVMSKLI